MKTIAIAAIAIVLIIALMLTFKAKLVVEKVLKKEPEEGMVLRVKYIALGLVVIAFLATFILLK